VEIGTQGIQTTKPPGGTQSIRISKPSAGTQNTQITKTPVLSTQDKEAVGSDASLLASGERVLLQTAVVPLHSLGSSVTVNT